MYTIYDYLKYYKNYSLKEIPWNIMDNLLCSIITYMPLSSFNETKDFNSLYEEVSKIKVLKKEDTMIPKTREILSIVKDSLRYKEMRFKNFINIINENTQFGAITCTINNIKVISYKGTDGSVIGWLENFRLIYEYPTYTQNLAIKYLEDNISMFDSEIYVTGHSKGGNLAMTSAMEINNTKFKKIKKVINFDGPGFRKEEYESLKYKRLKEKLINYIPTESYIGVLLFNDNYKVITSNHHAINVHYPTNWNCYGSTFIEGIQSKLSKELHERATINVSELDENTIREIFEIAFKSIDYKKTSRINLTLTDIMNLLKSVKGMDSKTSKYIYTIISTMLKLSKKKSN